jgi:hypothetical protein
VFFLVRQFCRRHIREEEKEEKEKEKEEEEEI